MALTEARLLKWDADHHRISFPGLFPDLTWVYTSGKPPGYSTRGWFGSLMGATGWKEDPDHTSKYVPRPPRQPEAALCRSTLRLPSVRRAIKAEAVASGRSEAAVQREAQALLRDEIAGSDENDFALRSAAWLMRKVGSNPNPNTTAVAATMRVRAPSLSPCLRFVPFCGPPGIFHSDALACP